MWVMEDRVFVKAAQAAVTREWASLCARNGPSRVHSLWGSCRRAESFGWAGAATTW